AEKQRVSHQSPMKVALSFRLNFCLFTFAFSSFHKPDADARGGERVLKLFVGRDARELSRLGAHRKVLVAELHVNEDLAVAWVRKERLRDLFARAQNVVAGSELDDERLRARASVLVA